jgi:hypothetical protein
LVAVMPGYIEDAVIRNRIRLRYDNMEGMTEPTRAEFIYASGTENSGIGFGSSGTSAEPLSEIDMKEYSLHGELALLEKFSLFITAPFRAVDRSDFESLTNDEDLEGPSDLRTGFRWGLLAAPDENLTFQVGVWAPTGDASQLLGTGHSSIDAGLLYRLRMSDRVTLFSELVDWQTLDAQEILVQDTNANEFLLGLDANVLRYGGGVGYDFFNACDRRDGVQVTGLVEVVGWTVLDGFVSGLDYVGPLVLNGDPIADNVISDATGDTILNGKYGMRIQGDTHSFYLGYGQNFTQDRWYSDLFRVDYTFFY